MEIVDWTGRMLREGKRGAIPLHLAPILVRLSVDARKWMAMVMGYDGWFYRAVGCVQRLKALAHALGLSWLKKSSATLKHLEIAFAIFLVIALFSYGALAPLAQSSASHP